MQILVGRRALNYILDPDDNYEGNLYTDEDIWGTDESQAHLSWGGLDLKYIPEEIMKSFSFSSKQVGIASAHDLLAIKLSHLGWDIFWDKHKSDVVLLFQLTKGIYNQELFKVLREYWVGVHGDKEHLSLHKTKEEFFDDFVKKYYEHDFLHELMAVDGIPIYTLCLKDNQEVLIDKSKWDELPFPLQIRMFQEEIAVIALERFIIPSIMKNKDITISKAWQLALRKTVTALTKGWATDFIIFNLDVFNKPIELDILRVLEELQLKEKYMSKQITLEEFKGILEGHFIQSGEDFEGEFNELLLGWGNQFDGVEFIEQEGGDEGGSEHCYTVFKINGVFYKITYSYYSYDGFDLNYAQVYVVEPKEKMVTVYE